MPVQQLMQMYKFTDEIMACVVLDTDKDLKPELITRIGSNQIIASPFHVYACIKDSKTGKPYAAWSRGNGRWIYIRWTKQNIIWCLQDHFYDTAESVRRNKSLLVQLESTLRCYPEPPKPDKPVLVGAKEIKQFMAQHGLQIGKK